MQDCVGKLVEVGVTVMGVFLVQITLRHCNIRINPPALIKYLLVLQDCVGKLVEVGVTVGGVYLVQVVRHGYQVAAHY